MSIKPVKRADGWTDEQHENFDEWSEHYATYQNWLQRNPQENKLFDMSVRNIQRKKQLDYYRGFIDSIAHLVAVLQNSVEKCANTDKKTAKETLKEYSKTLIKYIVEKNSNSNDFDQQSELLSAIVEAIPKNKEKEFYIGYRDGYDQLYRIVNTIYSNEKTFPAPYEVIKTIFFIQSGFCVGLMIENWPKDQRPSIQKPL